MKLITYGRLRDLRQKRIGVAPQQARKIAAVITFASKCRSFHFHRRPRSLDHRAVLGSAGSHENSQAEHAFFSDESNFERSALIQTGQQGDHTAVWKIDV